MKEILPSWPPVPTVVKEVYVDDAISALEGLDGYRCVAAVFRYAGEVLGYSYLPVTRDRVPISQLEAQILPLNVRMSRAKSIDKSLTAKYKASVVVCTRDRTDDLNRCILSLLPLLDDGHEVIVVDSCPSDEKTKKLMSQYPRVIYVAEPCPGAGIARSCGVRASTREFVAFTDDDAEVDSLWLAKLLRNFDDATVGLVTGLALPFELETPAQIWFEVTNTLSRGFERRAFDLTNLDPLVAGLLGATVSCAFRRSVFDSVGYFDPALGPGTPARASDDYEMFYRILAAGFRGVYDPSALVWHHHRRDWQALVSTVYNYSVSVYAWWTAALLFRNEWGLLRIGLSWFFARHVRQIRDLMLRRPGAVPKDLAFAELTGALMGPYSYFKSKRTMTGMLQRLHYPSH